MADFHNLQVEYNSLLPLSLLFISSLNLPRFNTINGEFIVSLFFKHSKKRAPSQQALANNEFFSLCILLITATPLSGLYSTAGALPINSTKPNSLSYSLSCSPNNICLNKFNLLTLYEINCTIVSNHRTSIIIYFSILISIV